MKQNKFWPQTNCNRSKPCCRDANNAAYAVRLAAQRSVVAKIYFTSPHQRRAAWSSGLLKNFNLLYLLTYVSW